MEFITALKDTPLPSILVIGGIIFLLLGIATIKKPIVIDVIPSNRKVALIFGIILVAIGVLLMAQPNIGKSETGAAVTASEFPLETDTIEVTNSPAELTIVENPILETESPTQLPSAEVVVDQNLQDLVITEVFGNPCDSDPRSEFIEIYNSGINEIDVTDLYITDGKDAEKLVAWASRYPSINLGSIMETTVIPPKGFAVILAPGYPYAPSYKLNPYLFPIETVILTVPDGQFLGDEINGIEVTRRDPIVLFQGDKDIIRLVISSYGSPIIGSSTLSVIDDGSDAIPFTEHPFGCWSVRRIFPVNEDIETNWEVTKESSPGTGDYP